MMTEEQRADLGQRYLLALMTRDAMVWHEHAKTFERGGHEDALSSKEAQTMAPHAQPEKPPDGKSGRHFMSEARNVAKAAFQTKYIREHPCKRCGGNIFYTSTGGCTACVRNFRKSRERPNEKEQRPCT
jgi:ribosomal protein L37E